MNGDVITVFVTPVLLVLIKNNGIPVEVSVSGPRPLESRELNLMVCHGIDMSEFQGWNVSSQNNRSTNGHATLAMQMIEATQGQNFDL